MTGVASILLAFVRSAIMTDYNFKPKQTRDDYGWYSRNLPHFDGPQQIQFVTFRLCDSMPLELLERWRKECKEEAQFRRRIERFLDSGHCKCWLTLEPVANLVKDALIYHNGKKYRLIAWVIMPNHVHALLQPYENEHLPQILHSIKSYTAQQANKILNRTGQFWQRESFDRYIRNARHFSSVISYIENNPVKAGLCARAEAWRFGSASEQSEMNASRSGKQDACRSSHDL